jgi:hypothetical protein
LWPDRFSAGLFGDASWLTKSGRLSSDASRQEGLQAEGSLDALEMLLDRVAGTARGRATLDLLVSDSQARSIILPWQASLTSPMELRGYAHACFARNGLAMDEGWVLQQGFRRYGKTGFAVAVSRPWLEQLAQRAEARRIKLRSILPVAAAAYWHPKRQVVGNKTLLLLADQAQCTALTMEYGSVSAFDTQPVLGDATAAITRLLRRRQATSPDVVHVSCWHPGAGSFDTGAVTHAMPQASVQVLPRHYWE